MSVNQADYKEIWGIIHKGSMPAMYADEIDWQMAFNLDFVKHRVFTATLL
jgi:hypothetical protein